MGAPLHDRGITPSGLPYRRVGDGPRTVLIIDGLNLDNAPASSLMARSFRFLGDDVTIWVVGRRRGMPPGYSLGDMAADVAGFIREHLTPPVDVIGTSTGGSIALHLAADHGDLVRRLVLHSAAHRLSNFGRDVQRRAAAFARAHQWAEVYRVLLECLLPRRGVMKLLRAPMVGMGSRLAAWADHPDEASDFEITVDAEDRLAFADRLAEIRAPTLVVAGAADPLYSEELFRETSAGIPNARLTLYPELGHPAMGRRFRRDVRAFLAPPDEASSPD